MKKNLTGALALAALAASPAWAALGGAPTYHGLRTVPDQRVMAAGKGAAAAYTVSTATLANGTVVREYLDAKGVVFGVAWNGPSMGSLQSLLGSYFPAWQQGLANARATRGGGAGPVSMHADDLVVESGGHMGALVGRAWLPRALPQGVSADQIR